MPRIVSVSSLKGGVGKTSIVLGLASAALHGGLKTLVIDLDPHGDASTGLAAEGGCPDIASILLTHDTDALTRLVSPSAWNNLVGTPTLLTSNPIEGGEIHVARGSARSALLDTKEPAPFIERLQNLIENTGSIYDLVLIDCPPFLGTLTATGWGASQRVLSIAEPSLFSVAGTERTLRAIVRFQKDENSSVEAAAVVVNKLRADDPEHSYRYEELKALFGQLVAEPTFNEEAVIQRALGAAHPIHFWPDEEAVEPSIRFTRLLAGLMAAL